MTGQPSVSPVVALTGQCSTGAAGGRAVTGRTPHRTAHSTPYTALPRPASACHSKPWEVAFTCKVLGQVEAVQGSGVTGIDSLEASVQGIVVQWDA